MRPTKQRPRATVAAREAGKASYSRITTGPRARSIRRIALGQRTESGSRLPSATARCLASRSRPRRCKPRLIDFSSVQRESTIRFMKLKEVLENGLVRKVDSRLEGRAHFARSLRRASANADEAPLMAFAKECDGEIQDFVSGDSHRRR